MMSLTFGLFTQLSGSGPLGPLVSKFPHEHCCHVPRVVVQIRASVRVKFQFLLHAALSKAEHIIWDISIYKPTLNDFKVE